MPRANHNPGKPPHPSHLSGIGFGTCCCGDRGPELGVTLLPDAGDSHGGLEPPPLSSGQDSGSCIETNHTSFTNLSNTDGSTTPGARWASCLTYPPHPLGNLYSVSGVNLISPFQFNDPSNYAYQMQSPWSTQETECANNKTGYHLHFHPNYLQHPAVQEGHLASGFQSLGSHPTLDTDNRARSPLPPPRRHARRSSRGRKPENYSNLDTCACNTCGINFKRQSDLNRHLKTARKHGVPGGPVCPEIGCKYTARFTRVDNFRAHYRGKHGKSDGESDGFIQEWKARGRP